MEFRNGQIVEVSSAVAHSFKGEFPTVDTYPSVDPSLTEGDESPVFITLDVLEDNRVSSNGLFYEPTFNQALEPQIEGESGTMGHPSFFGDRAGAQGDEVYWVGHKREGDTVWAKAYIPPSNLRNHIIRKKRQSGGIGTSVVVQGAFRWISEEKQIFTLDNPELLRIDLVHAKEAALRKFSGFKITSETTTRGVDYRSSEPEETDMLTKENFLAALTVNDVPANIREAILKEANTEATVARVSQLEKDLTEVTSKLTTAETQLTETRAALTTANEQIAESQRIAFERAMNDAVSEKTASWNIKTVEGKATVANLHHFIRMVASQKLGETRDAESITNAVNAAWDENKALVENTVRGLAGPGAIVGGSVPQRQNTGETGNKKPAADIVKELAEKYGSIVKSTNGNGNAAH